MKIEEYSCVTVKRGAQERIHAETRNLTLEDQIARHRRSFAEVQKRKEELVGKVASKARG